MIMAKRLQTFFLEDYARINKMNLLMSVIQKQHKKLLYLDKLHKFENKSLHFAFMFACPLALSFDSQNQTKI